MLKDYFTLPHAAKAIGVSVPTLKKLMGEKRIGYTKIGNRYRFAPEEIKRFIEAHTYDAAE